MIETIFTILFLVALNEPITIAQTVKHDRVEACFYDDDHGIQQDNHITYNCLINVAEEDKSQEAWYELAMLLRYSGETYTKNQDEKMLVVFGYLAGMGHKGAMLQYVIAVDQGVGVSGDLLNFLSWYWEDNQ